MKYTKEDIIQYCELEDVKFVRLAFCDVFGTMKNIAILPSELRRAFDDGISIDGSAIKGFGSVVHSDLFLHPDPSTLTSLPWRSENGSVVRMLCSVNYPDGTPLEGDSRAILQEAIEYAESRGVSFSFGSEMEFYLFTLDDDSNPTMIPYDQAGYMDIAPDDKGENVRREICLTLAEMGIVPETSHHEEGPGQNEIDFRYSEAMSAADNAVTFKSVTKTIVSRNGLWACFDPKPLEDQPGNGLHINISATDSQGKSILFPVVAGILDKIRDITLFLNPSEQSYKRLGGYKAPSFVSWSKENRSQLIRIPATHDGIPRIELRSADSLANPYIAFALLIYAGLAGIEEGIDCPESADINLYTASNEVTSAFEKLPQGLEEAIECAISSDFVKSHLPQSVIDSYCRR